RLAARFRRAWASAGGCWSAGSHRLPIRRYTERCAGHRGDRESGTRQGIRNRSGRARSDARRGASSVSRSWTSRRDRQRLRAGRVSLALFAFIQRAGGYVAITAVSDTDRPRNDAEGSRREVADALDGAFRPRTVRVGFGLL